MKNRKIHLPKLLSWQEGTVMSGHCLAQLNTQCDHGTWTVLVLGRAQGSTPGIWCRAKGWAPKLLQLPKSPLQWGVCPRKQGKEFFHSQLFRDVPANLSLSYSRAEPMVSRQQQENPSKQRFARLGNRLFHTEFCYQEHIFPTMGSPPKQGPLFHEVLQASSCSQLLHQWPTLSSLQGQRGSGVISLHHQIMRQRKASNTAKRSPRGSETTSVHMEIALPTMPARKKPQAKEHLAAVVTLL